MPETFVPLVAPTSKVRETGFTSLNVKSSAPVVTLPPAAETCSKPTVTLQKSGDIVTGIRVQCGCGQVLDLTCTY